MITAKLTVGRRTVTAKGDTALQARGRALAAYRKKWGEHAKGGSFSLSGRPTGGGPSPKPSKPKPKPKGRRKSRKKAPQAAADAPTPAPAPRRGRKVVKLPVGDLRYGSRLVLGTTAAGTIVDAMSAPTLEGARALAQSDAVKGALRTIVDVVNVYGDTGRQVEGPQKLDAASLVFLDRVVIGAKANGELLEVRVLRGDLGQARAVAHSLNANRAVVGSVHHVYRA